MAASDPETGTPAGEGSPEQAGGDADRLAELSPLALYKAAGNVEMVRFLTTCNSCGVNPMAPGRDMCIECLAEPV